MKTTFDHVGFNHFFAPMPVMELKAIRLQIYSINILQLMDDGSYRRIKTARITKGDRVLIVNGELKPLPDDTEPTHQITSCMGTATSDFSISVIDLKSQELSHIKL